MKSIINEKLFPIVFTLLLPFLIFSCSSNKTNDTISPNGKIKVKVETVEKTKSDYGEAYFNVEYVNGDISNPVFSNSRIGLETNLRNFGENLKLISVSDPIEITEDYKMITGKRSHCINKAIERTYRFENFEKQSFDVVFRAYDDGVVFRYAFDSVADGEEIINEFTTYSVSDGKKRWISEYYKDYERFYPLATSGQNIDNPEMTKWAYPALIECSESLFTLITEANIRKGHSASWLDNSTDKEKYQVCLSDKALSVNGSFASPWRVLIIGSLADVVESTLVTDVSDPCKVSETDWIVPGVASWIYWAYNNSSSDFQIVKEYIDLAANMGWTYNLIDWKWNGMANGGNINDAIEYASEKGVETMLWYNSGTAWIGPGAPQPLDRLLAKESREKEYEWLREMKVAAIKIDFFDGDGVDMMDYYIDILEDAANYNLMINFHGSTIPRGWQRTYPHMMTMEAVYGAEWYNNKPILTDRAAEHNATLPFTRNVIGPMDYTPGTFSDSQHPHITSHGHELALLVAFESAFQHMPDRPSTYYSLPEEVKSFLSELPTAWDDTKLLTGYPGEEIVIARRKGDAWYIAGLNGTNEPKTLPLSLMPLSQSGKTMTIFKDGTEERSFAIENHTIADNDTEMSIECLPRGGFVAVIK